MLLGYCISVPDNDHYMYENMKLPDCARYMDVYSINMYDPNFKFKKRKVNISETWDGFIIVSEIFKRFCEKEKYAGLEFISLPLTNKFYWLKVNNIKDYDTEAAKTRFLYYNKECKGYGGVYGANPVCLKEKILLDDNFYRTDICFGDYEKKSPLYLVGEGTKLKLKNVGFKEISFEKILDEYTWQKLENAPNKLIVKKN
jgi:hypothetical protein